MNYNPLQNNHNSIQLKAIQKYPFHINDKTYFSSECYYNKQIVNGISLNLKEARGIPNNSKLISYLSYSQRLIFYVGKNIMTYNSYKKMYQEIIHAQNLIHLKALSLRNIENQYILWVQKWKKPIRETNDINKSFGNSQLLSPKPTQDYYYKLCLYDLAKEQMVMNQNFYISLDYEDIFVFVYPVKMLGFVSNSGGSTIVNFKNIKAKKNYGVSFDNLQEKTIFPVKIKHLIYNLENNQYLFLNGNKICSLNISRISRNLQQNTSEMVLSVYKIITIPQTEGYILDYSINSSFIVLLLNKYQTIVTRYKEKEYKDGFKSKQENESANVEEEIQTQIRHQLKFYSLFSHDLIMHEKLSKHNDFSPSPYALPTKFSISTNTIVLYNEGAPLLSIWSIYEQNLKYIKQVNLDFQNFHRLSKFFINPYSSQAIILTDHYELEGSLGLKTFTKSSKLNRAPSLGFKDFFLQVSLFHFAVDVSFLPMKKMQLRKRKYQNILCCPWLSEYFFQTDNSIIGFNWQQKLQYTIKCSAIHPTGQYLLLGSNDFFKMYGITYEGLQSTYVSQSVKDCVAVDYHPSGKEFSVASNSLITIYHSYEYTKLYHINLTLSYKVKEVNYEPDGQSFTLLTQNKRIHSYKIKQSYQEQFAFNPRAHIVPDKKTIIDSVIVYAKQINSFHTDNVSAIIYDRQVGVVIYSLNNNIYFLSSLTYESLGYFQFQPISCFFLYKPLGTLFIGTFKGDIVCFPWPNKPINIKSQLPRYHCHSSPIIKIKVTSDRLQLISITEESVFRHELALIVNMRKIEKFELQKEYHKNQVMILDFFVRRGYHFYTTDFANKKIQTLKQFEEQAVNVNFILPQERERQKHQMLKNLKDGQQEISNENLKILLPLKQEAIGFKRQLQILKGEFTNLHQMQNRKIQEETLNYEKKFSLVNIEKDKLVKKRNQLILMLSSELKSQKDRIRKDKKKDQIILYMKVNEMENRKNKVKQESEKNEMNFLELDEMEEQKNIFKRTAIEQMDEEILFLNQRNGYLMSRNNTLLKDIMIEKRKTQDVRDLIQNTERGILKLLMKRKPKFTQNESIHQRFYETEKKYLEQTKCSIEKGKAINVSLAMYEKQKDLLIALEKELDKTQKSIDNVIEHLTSEKKERRECQSILDQVRKKVQQLTESDKKVKNIRVVKTNIQKDFKYKVALFLDNALTVQQLRKVSKTTTKLCQFQNSTNLLQAIISKQQNQIKIIKAFKSQQKTLANIKQGQKIFLQEKKKINQHNQDLIDNVNTLTHQNKYFMNVIKTQQDKKKKEFKNYISIKRKKKDQVICKPTVFENYITYKKARSTRRVKTNPCAEYQL